MQWDCGNLVTLGWSDAEELIGVQDDGTIFLHDMFGNFVHKFSVGKDVTDVADARIFTSASGTGVAVMTSGFKIYILNNIKDPKSRPLSELLSTPGPSVSFPFRSESPFFLSLLQTLPAASPAGRWCARTAPPAAC